MNCAKLSAGIGPSSICRALRQNGSFASLKRRRIRLRLLPRYTCATCGLCLEDGAHERRKARIEIDDLLELVEDDGDAAAALGRELGR